MCYAQHTAQIVLFEQVFSQILMNAQLAHCVLLMQSAWIQTDLTAVLVSEVFCLNRKKRNLLCAVSVLVSLSLSKWVCVCVRACVYVCVCVYMCVIVCVCEREGERERERDWEREGVYFNTKALGQPLTNCGQKKKLSKL